MVGWFVARIVRRIVTGLLAAAGVDRLGERVGLGACPGAADAFRAARAARLHLHPGAGPDLGAQRAPDRGGHAPGHEHAQHVPRRDPEYLRRGGGAGDLLRRRAGWWPAWSTNLLAGIGFDTIPARLGLTTGVAAVGRRTPSQVVGTLVLVAVMLFATVEALRLLGFVVLADLVAEFIQLGGQILLGLVIFAIGLYLAGLAEDLVRSSGTANAGLLGLLARVAVLVLSGAMALRQMGIANEIVNLAFGLLLGAVAVAAAIAFGFGGREIAGRELERWVQEVKARAVTDRGGPPRRATIGTMSPPSPPHGPRPAPLIGFDAVLLTHEAAVENHLLRDHAEQMVASSRRRAAATPRRVHPAGAHWRGRRGCFPAATSRRTGTCGEG